MTQIKWTQDPVPAEGRDRTRIYRVARPPDPSPAPGGNRPSSLLQPPLILMGHGGGGHKRNDRMHMLGRLFSAVYGWCAAAIDGPVHGERGPGDRCHAARVSPHVAKRSSPCRA